MHGTLRVSDFRGLDRRRNKKKRVMIGLYKKTKAAIQVSLDALFLRRKKAA